MPPVDAAGLLAEDHRLMDRAVRVLAGELRRARGEGGDLDLALLAEGLRFLEEYAETVHHSREEGLLFHELATRKLSGEHRATLVRCIEDHARIRAMHLELAAAIDVAEAGGGDGMRDDLLKILDRIVVTYSDHLRNEDRFLFGPAMSYLSREGKGSMVRESQESGWKGVQDKYRAMVASWESRAKRERREAEP
jgi:hemerythrin-like domain-containing protein